MRCANSMPLSVVAAFRALVFSLWETSWRGMSTVRQTSGPVLHVQTLSVKWWVSLPEECASIRRLTC